MTMKVAKLILVLGISALLSGCGHPDKDGRTKWPEVNREVDSLTQRLDFEIFHRLPEEEVSATLAELDSCAKASGENGNLRGRVNYFRAFLALRQGDPEKSTGLLSTILSETDSAREAYLYNRALHLADDDTERSVNAFDRIEARLRYFESVGDAFMTASQLTELGNLLKDVRDPEGAIDCYSKADSLYRLAGYADNAVLNRMNVASAMIVKRDTTGAARVYRELLCDSTVITHPAMRAKVYHNLAAYTNDSSALDSLIKIEGQNAPAISFVFLSQRELASGRPETAAAMADSAANRAVEEDDADALAYAGYAAAEAYAAMGNKDVAYDRLHEAVELTDAISLANEPDEIQMLETGRQLSVRRLEAELRQSRKTLFWVCLSSGLLLVLVITLWIFSGRLRRLRLERKEASAERDKMSRKLLATQAAMDETSQLINDVGRKIGDMADSGEMPYGATRPIVNAIKTHRIRQKSRESFVESFTGTHPEFARRLREFNEAITEPDIRLAAYIVAGMDNKQIASTMGVRPESVKQGRWRLRTKLGLQRGDRLEDTLRRIAGE